jgi:malate dehydrogenase (oxaloacetate-decarboxylating)
MKHAAANAIAGAVSDEERSIGVIIPSLFHPDLHRLVAVAVRDAAEEVTARPRTRRG